MCSGGESGVSAFNFDEVLDSRIVSIRGSRSPQTWLLIMQRPGPVILAALLHFLAYFTLLSQLPYTSGIALLQRQKVEKSPK